jgi:hypothetical protein
VTTVAEIGKIPTLKILVADLEVADREIRRLHESVGGEAEYLASCELHWAIREAINGVPARTLSELKAKARAAEIELERDAADCEGAGSFLELSRSIVADLKAMNAAKAPYDAAVATARGVRG